MSEQRTEKVRLTDAEKIAAFAAMNAPRPDYEVIARIVAARVAQAETGRPDHHDQSMRVWVAPDAYDNPTLWTDGPSEDFPKALLVRVPSNADLFDWCASHASPARSAVNTHSIHRPRYRPGESDA